METSLHVDFFRFYKNNEFLKSMFDHLKLSVWYKNAEDNSFWVSNECAKIYGCKQSDFENDPQIWERFVFLDDIAIVEGHTKKVLSGRPSTIEYRIIRSDGMVRWVKETANSIADEQGNVILHTSMVLDITQPKTAAQSHECDPHLIELSPHSVLLHKDDDSNAENLTDLTFHNLVMPVEKDHIDNYFEQVNL